MDLFLNKLSRILTNLAFLCTLTLSAQNDCVDAILKLFNSSFKDPINIGSDEKVSQVRYRLNY